MMAGAKEHGAALRHRHSGNLHRSFEIGGSDLGARRNMEGRLSKDTDCSEWSIWFDAPALAVP